MPPKIPFRRRYSTKMSIPELWEGLAKILLNIDVKFEEDDPEEQVKEKAVKKEVT